MLESLFLDVNQVPYFKMILDLAVFFSSGDLKMFIRNKKVIQDIQESRLDQWIFSSLEY